MSSISHTVRCPSPPLPSMGLSSGRRDPAARDSKGNGTCWQKERERILLLQSPAEEWLLTTAGCRSLHTFGHSQRALQSYADDLPRFSFDFPSTHQLDPGELAPGIANSGIPFSLVKLLHFLNCEERLIVLSNNCNNSQHFHIAIHLQRVSLMLTN